MKFTFIQKLGLIIIGIIFITFFVNYLVKSAISLRLKRESEKKAANVSKNIRARTSRNEENETDEEWEKYMNGDDGKVREGLLALEIMELAMQEVSIDLNVAEIGSTISNFMLAITNMIETIAVYVSVCAMLGELIVGIFNHVMCGATEFSSGFDNSMTTVGILAKCSWDKFVKFWNGNCTRYYLTDMIFGILYGILVELPCVIIYAIFGMDLQPLVNLIYEIIVLPLDNIIFSISGYHITKWSDSVVKDCYRCTGTYNYNGQDITLTKSFNEWAATFGCSGKQMEHGIIKIFQSIIPSPKWGSWIMGQHLDGKDDNPAF